MKFTMSRPAQRGEGNAVIGIRSRRNASARWRNGIGLWFFVWLDPMSFHFEWVVGGILVPIIF
jgi:hypothetical protein